MTQKDWQREDAHTLGVFLNGEEIPERTPDGQDVVDDSFLLLFNALRRGDDVHAADAALRGELAGRARDRGGRAGGPVPARAQVTSTGARSSCSDGSDASPRNIGDNAECAYCRPMSSDAWPSSDASPAPLPRIEDLPLADHGYDQEAVRLAFDSFYRHAAQLDASLRALEAVEVFRRDADALRNDLRALRALGVGGGAEPAWATRTYESPRREIAGRRAPPRGRVGADRRRRGDRRRREVPAPTVIIMLMAGAFLIVALSEWLASRARFVPPTVAFLPEDFGEPAPYVEVPAPGWEQQALGPGEDTEADALTMIESPAAGDRADPWEQGVAEAEAEPEPELAERGGLFRRRRR